MSVSSKSSWGPRAITSVGIFGLVLGLAFASYKEAEQRHPNGFWVSAKPRVPFGAMVFAPQGLPESPEEATVLEARVETLPGGPVALEDRPMLYRWNLPEGVAIDSGEMSGTLLNLTQGPQTVTITVRGLSASVEQSVSLDLTSEMEGQTIGWTAVYSTFTTERDLSRRAREPASKGWFMFGKSKSEEPGPQKKAPKGLHL